MYQDLLVGGILGLVVLLRMFYVYGTKRTIKITVQDKGTLSRGYVNDGNGTTWTDFMVYTKNDIALKNVNSLFFWKWRSAELQAKIQKGKTYEATIYGWRIGALGLYPNIVKIREKKSKK